MSGTIGILGGMGPLATVDLFAKIVANTPADHDQANLHIIVDDYPQIPSRIEALQHGAKSPLPYLLESARLLERAGADFIVMPCNTAHVWLPELRAQIGVPFLSIIENAAERVAAQAAGDLEILLLATAPLVDTELYQRAFAARGRQLRLPEPDDQELVMSMIREVKAGRIIESAVIAPFAAMLGRYAEGGTRAVLGACTEVPLTFPHLGGGILKLDPTLMLAQAAVARAKCL